MKKEKRKRSASRLIKLPYTLIAISIVVITFVLGFATGTILVTLPEQPLKAEWDGFMTETYTYKATHNPIIPVTQTVSAIETQWIEIQATQTAIGK